MEKINLSHNNTYENTFTRQDALKFALQLINTNRLVGISGKDLPGNGSSNVHLFPEVLQISEIIYSYLNQGTIPSLS